MLATTDGKICPFAGGQCRTYFCAFWSGSKETGNCMIWRVANRKLELYEEEDDPSEEEYGEALRDLDDE